MQRIRKELTESNGDYEGTAVWNLHSDRSDKKIILEFVGEIQAKIDSYPCKSIRSIASDIGVSEFLIRQVVYKDILYFSYKMRKGNFLLQATRDKRKVRAAEFKKLKHPIIIKHIIYKKVKLATIVEGDPKAPFSIATTPRRYSFSWIAPLYP